MACRAHIAVNEQRTRLTIRPSIRLLPGCSGSLEPTRFSRDDEIVCRRRLPYSPVRHRRADLCPSLPACPARCIANGRLKRAPGDCEPRLHVPCAHRRRFSGSRAAQRNRVASCSAACQNSEGRRLVTGAGRFKHNADRAALARRHRCGTCRGMGELARIGPAQRT